MRQVNTSFSIRSDPTLKPEHIMLKGRETFCYIKNEEYHKADGLAAIVTRPQHLKTYQHGEYKWTQKVVILVHGHLSHKNAIYQPLLADTLSDLGYFVIRFDFRNQGDSEDNRDKNSGRTIVQDLKDLDTVINCIDSNTKGFSDIFGENKLSLEMVIAHSRGVLPMLSSFSDLNNKVSVPILINCCGRFSSEGLLRRYTRMYPNWEDEKGFWTKTFRYGKYSDYWVPYEEIISAGHFSNDQFTNIPGSTNIVNIYGSCDTIIPIKDAEKYHELFNPRSFIFLVPGGDHNFYGLPDDKNDFNLPTKRGKVNYSYYLVALLYLTIKNNSFESIDEEKIKVVIPDIQELLS